MSRPRKYDEGEVLAAAMRVFWTDGSGASTRRLAKAMGINQYSVYDCFKSKAGLFEQSLNRYIDDIVAGSVLLPLLQPEHAALTELRQFLEGFVDTKDVDAPNGCFVCNTMIEASEHPIPVQRAIKRYRELVTKTFSRALKNEFPDMPRAVVRERSEFLFGAILGLFVQKKMGANGKPIQIFVDEIMASVERPFKSAHE